VNGKWKLANGKWKMENFAANPKKLHRQFIVDLIG
jgi:hypothetical protein